MDTLEWGTFLSADAVLDARAEREWRDAMTAADPQGPIGTYSATRLVCADEHLPSTYHPQMDVTWCVCGERTWEGRTPEVWKCREITRQVRPTPTGGVGQGGPGAAPTREVTGYDIYTLRSTP